MPFVALANVFLLLSVASHLIGYQPFPVMFWLDPVLVPCVWLSCCVCCGWFCPVASIFSCCFPCVGDLLVPVGVPLLTLALCLLCPFYPCSSPVALSHSMALTVPVVSLCLHVFGSLQALQLSCGAPVCRPGWVFLLVMLNPGPALLFWYFLYLCVLSTLDVLHLVLQFRHLIGLWVWILMCLSMSPLPCIVL